MKNSKFDRKVVSRRDKDALKYIADSISMYECVSILSCRDMGKDIVYENLIKELEGNKEFENIIAEDVTDLVDLEEALDKIEMSDTSTLAILDFSLDEDISFALKKLSNIRTKRDAAFVYVVFVNLRHVRELIISKDKSLFRGIYMLPILDSSDSDLVLKSFERRYDKQISQECKDKIMKVASGQIGLMKSLFLFAARNECDMPQEKELLEMPSVLHRLESIVGDALENPTDEEIERNLWLLAKLGFTKSGKLFSPLVNKYYEQLKLQNKPIEELLSYSERKVFDLLKDKNDTVVSRDEVAKCLWSEEWEERYSDWAIDQTIYRIRKALGSSKYNLQTKKKQGFILQIK